MSQVEKQTNDKKKQTKATTHSKGTIWKNRHVFLCHSRYRLDGKYGVLFFPCEICNISQSIIRHNGLVLGNSLAVMVG